METSIMDLVTGAFRGNTLQRLSSQLNESPTAVERGIAQAVPLSVASFAEQAQSEQSAGDLLSRIREGNYPHMDPSELGQVISDPAAIQRTAQSSSGFLSGFLGGKLNTMLDMVTGSSGLSRPSAGMLLGLVAPMVLGWVGKNVKAKGLNAHGLSRLLADEGHKVSGRLPAGFSTMFKTGAGGLAGGLAGAHEPGARVEYEPGGAGYSREPSYRTRETGSDVSQRQHVADVSRVRTEPEKRRSRGLPWLLAALLGLVALLLWWGSRRDERARAPDIEAPPVAVAPSETERPSLRTERPSISEPARPQAVAPVAPEGQRPQAAAPEGQRAEPALERQPVAGTDLMVLRGDARSLQVFFEEKGPVPQRFLLEDLEFDTGTAGIGSNAMLNEAARTLAANPDARVRIEGHTDNQGTDQNNQALSQRRADAVKDYLVRQGAPEKQLSSIGMSARNPIADNATPEGRAQNRRVELIVIER